MLDQPLALVAALRALLADWEHSVAIDVQALGHERLPGAVSFAIVRPVFESESEMATTDENITRPARWTSASIRRAYAGFLTFVKWSIGRHPAGHDLPRHFPDPRLSDRAAAMKLAIPKERRAGETRVAATPETVKKFKGLRSGRGGRNRRRRRRADRRCRLCRRRRDHRAGCGNGALPTPTSC